ncbi:MAG: hypothetical protein Q8P51_13165 [Ignavibacteria bacterium]|nr:hypothetical protein [Ignavibacteria bacterium]
MNIPNSFQVKLRRFAGFGILFFLVKGLLWLIVPAISWALFSYN